MNCFILHKTPIGRKSYEKMLSPFMVPLSQKIFTAEKWQRDNWDKRHPIFFTSSPLLHLNSPALEYEVSGSCYLLKLLLGNLTDFLAHLGNTIGMILHGMLPIGLSHFIIRCSRQNP